MATLPVSPSLNRQDFPEAPNWIVKVLYPIQLFMTNVLNALRGQLTLSENLSTVIRETTITAGAADTNNTYSFPWPFARQILELTAYATNLDTTSTTPIYLQVSWVFINGNIQINGMKGLTTGSKYNIIIVAK